MMGKSNNLWLSTTQKEMAISDLWRGPSYSAVVVAIPQLSVNVSHDL